MARTFFMVSPECIRLVLNYCSENFRGLGKGILAAGCQRSLVTRDKRSGRQQPHGFVDDRAKKGCEKGADRPPRTSVLMVIFVPAIMRRLIPGLIRVVIVVLLEVAFLVVVPVMHLVISAILHSQLIIFVLRIVVILMLRLHIVVVFLRSGRRDCACSAAGHPDSKGYRRNPHALLQVISQCHDPLPLPYQFTFSILFASWSNPKDRSLCPREAQSSFHLRSDTNKDKF